MQCEQAAPSDAALAVVVGSGTAPKLGRVPLTITPLPSRLKKKDFVKIGFPPPPGGGGDLQKNGRKQKQISKNKR